LHCCGVGKWPSNGRMGPLGRHEKGFMRHETASGKLFLRVFLE